MRNATFLQWVAVVVATVGVCFPQMALGANPVAKQAPVVTDVKLMSGTLLGQVVDAQGKPMAGVPVSLSSGTPIPARKVSPDAGSVSPGITMGATTA